jgi:hypothetical protein
VPPAAAARILLLGRGMPRFWLALGALSLATACSEAHPSMPDGAAGSGGEGASAPASVEIGVPGGEDGLDFVPVGDGGELRLQTFGQGGTHVLVAVRCTGFGNRAFVSATLANLTTDVVVEEPPPARPQLLYCGDDGFCELIPYLVHASGIAETDEERDGLRVRLTAHVRSESGVEAVGSHDAVLSTADL